MSRLLAVLSLVALAATPASAWLTTVSGDAPAIDTGKAIAKGPDGNLVVAGTVHDAGIGSVLVVSKLTPGGTTFWRRDVASDPVGSTEGRVLSVGGVAVGADDDVAVAGTAPGAEHAELVVVKLAGTTGVTRWTTSVAGGGGFVRAQDVAVAPGGDVIVAGTLAGPDLEKGSDFTVIRFDGATGVERWRFTWATDGQGMANAVAVDAAGDVLAAGRVRNGDDDFAVAKLDGQTGAYRWRRSLGAGVYDEAFDLAVDVDGSVYVAGGLTPAGVARDFAVVKLSAAGDVAWTSTFDGGAATYDQAYALALGPPGFVVATGSTVTNDATSNDFTVARFKADSGEVDRRITLADPPEVATIDGGHAITVDADAAIVAAGTYADRAFAIRIRDNGTRAWERSLDGEPSVVGNDALAGVALAPDGDPLVVGTLTRAGSGMDFVVGRLEASDGSDVWQTVFAGTGSDSFDFGSAVALDAHDDVIAGGGTSGASYRPDFTVVKAEGKTGALLWRRALGGSDATDDGESVWAVATDETSDVLAAGTLATDTGPAFTVVKLAGSDGDERWRSVTTGGESGWEDAAHAVAVAPNGDVVAAGQTTGPTTGADFTVVRLAGASGEERWRAVLTPEIGGYEDLATSLAVGVNGDITAAGAVEYELSGVPVFTVARLAPESGEELWRAAALDAEDEPRQGRALGLGLDLAGNAVAAGYIYDADQLPEGVVLSLAAGSGAERWRFTLTGEAGEYSVLEAVETVPGGDVIAAGWARTASGSTVLVVRLDGNTGRERWRRSFAASAGAEAGAADLALGAGDVLLSAVFGPTQLLARLDDATGAVVWQETIPQMSVGFPGTALVADDDGNPVVVSAHAIPGSGTDLALREVSIDDGGEIICGDGVRDDGEACDDGNRLDGDCCSAACVVEDAPVCGPDDPGPGPDDPEVACAGERVPAGVTRGIAKAKRLLDAADEETRPRRAARLTRRATRILGKASRLIERAAKVRRRTGARIGMECAAALRAVVAGLRP